MNTFHVSPSDKLASEAAIEVATFPDNAYVAVRGVHEQGSYEMVYGVFEMPGGKPASNKGYLWTYVNVQEWLREYGYERGLS